MGIAVEAARWIMSQCAARGIGGRCLTLGKQDVSFDADQMFRLLAEHGIVDITQGSIELTPRQVRLFKEFELSGKLLSRKVGDARRNFISDEFLLRFAGFDEVRSLDANDFEGCDIVYDLNRDDPGDLCGQFDLILDCGTIEHVFHVPNAMKSIWAMLKVGGHVIHMAPTNNYVDHGFYQFSPTFFFDFYEANKFADLDVVLMSCTTDVNGTPWNFQSYRPGMLDAISSGGLDEKMYETFVIARRIEQSTGDAVPGQRRYVKKLWRA
jgi:SAM-dependent methyltransferase